MDIRIVMPDQVRFILERLMEKGWQAYIVGGCVRDSLMGRIPKDWDICTSARPENVAACFPDFHCIETGLQHGTLTVIVEKMPLEITSFRIDGEYEDGRHPKSVQFTEDLRMDLSRRDFTINAMAYNEGDRLVDPFGGQGDLEKKQIRCVGEAELRFQEDALRILRMFRFAAELGFRIEKDTLRAAEARRDLLNAISKERIMAELNRILMADDPMPVLQEMVRTGVFDYIIPEFRETAGFDQQNPYHNRTVDQHTLLAVNLAPPDLVVRLALLLHDIGKPRTFSVDENLRGHFYGHAKVGADMAEEILRRLKYDNRTREDVVTLVRCHDVDFAHRRTWQIKRMMGRLGVPLFRKLVEVKRADNAAHTPEFVGARAKLLDQVSAEMKEILAQGECFTLKDLAVGGRDLMAIGVPAGKEVGRVLNELLELVLADSRLNEREILLAKAGEIREKN